MSIYGGMFTGVSALAAQSTAFGAISDNIANVNTVGYKDTRAQFQTLVTESSSNTRYSPGGLIARPFINPEEQGQLQGTLNETDVSIIGNGFFVVNDASSPTISDPYAYTRAGSFNPDENGNLKNTAGYFLQGWATDQNGNITNATTQDLLTSLETVSLSGFSSIANPTQNVTIAANLPASAAVAATETTNLTVYDSLGVSHLLTFNWTKAAANNWTYTVDLTNNAGVTTADLNGGARAVVFGGDGTLTSVNGDATNTVTTALTIPTAAFNTGANAGAVTINWGNAGTTSGLSQFSDSYSASLLNQDGSEPSALTDVEVNGTGRVTANFANGQSRPIYQLAVATISASTQMSSENGNAFSISEDSGNPTLNVPGNAGSGIIESQALEQSTVDISEEFTDMIITQRAYSAATKLITTGDQLLEEVIRLKR